MGSATGAVEETIERLAAQGEKVGLVTVRLYRPFSTGDLVAALPPTARSVAVLDRTQGSGRGRRAALPGRGHRARRAARQPAARDRRPLRPRLEGVHARDGRSRLRGARRPRAEAPLHGRDPRRRLGHEPRGRPGVHAPSPTTSSAPSSSASAPTARSARTRTRSRSSPRRQASTPRATSSTTRRRRARPLSRTCASARIRSARPT